MGALKPRTTRGPVAADKEGRVYVIKIPLEEDNDRAVFTLDGNEAMELGRLLSEATADA